MRLIDADDSYTLNASDNTDYSLCFGGGIISVIDKHGHIDCEFFADDAPTIDAVPVVRCKDCVYWQSGENEAEKWEYCRRHRIDIGPHSFCSCGERRNT